MRAVAVGSFRAVPELMELRSPTIRDDEVLVQLEFAGINPFDWKIADGLFEKSRPHVFPLILGVDGAGIVEAIGPTVRRFKVGDRLFGQFLHDPVGTGTYAELAPVPEGIAVTHVPDGLKTEDAAALPTAGMTALASLDALDLSRGSTLVIVGASGGVGSFATELAVARGLRVTAIARANSVTRLRSLGAEKVLDPSSADAQTALARTHPSGVDGLLDLMSDGPGLARWASVVHRGGALATTTYSADIASLERAGVHGTNIDLQPTAALLERLAHEVVTHHLKVPLERIIRLPDAAAGLAELKAGRAAGKTVIRLFE
jgi:NADPH:quinone reductase-like Zn-dependent oxidoreductase